MITWAFGLSVRVLLAHSGYTHAVWRGEDSAVFAAAVLHGDVAPRRSSSPTEGRTEVGRDISDRTFCPGPIAHHGNPDQTRGKPGEAACRSGHLPNNKPVEMTFIRPRRREGHSAQRKPPRGRERAANKYGAGTRTKKRQRQAKPAEAEIVDERSEVRPRWQKRRPPSSWRSTAQPKKPGSSVSDVFLHR